MNAILQALGDTLTKEPRTVLRLYEVADALEAIETDLLENGGELTPEMELALEAMEGALETKCERICRVIKNHDASAKAFEDEIDRLNAHKQAHANISNRMKSYLHTTMTRLQRDKVSAGVFKLAIQNNSRPKIEWTKEPEALPEPFKRVRVELDGNAAYEAVKAGETLPEGFTVTTGNHLRIR